MKKSEIILLICVIIQTLFIFLDYLGIKPNPNWPFYITKIFEFLIIKIPLIWCLVSITITALLGRLFSRRKNQIPIADTDVQNKQKNESDLTPTEEKIDKKKDALEELSKEEKYILALLVHRDGRELTVETMQKNIDLSNIRISNAINKLKKRYLIKQYGGMYSFHPEAYILTDKGHELVVNLDWDEKLKKPITRQSS